MVLRNNIDLCILEFLAHDLIAVKAKDWVWQTGLTLSLRQLISHEEQASSNFGVRCQRSPHRMGQKGVKIY